MRIDLAVQTGAIRTNPALVAAFDNAKATTGRLHLLGLVSDGGVHSHIRHLFALLDAAQAAGVPKTYVHFFADGRDTGPATSGACEHGANPRRSGKKDRGLAARGLIGSAGRASLRARAWWGTATATLRSADGFARDLLAHLAQTGYGRLATVVGRYYAMDRDTRWERIQVAYEAVVKGKGEPSADVVAVGPSVGTCRVRVYRGSRSI